MRWGPQPLGGDRTRFALWAPDRDTVATLFDNADLLVVANAL